MPISDDTPPTLRQFHRNQVSDLWAEYKRKRELLDKSVTDLEEAGAVSGASLPTCNSPGCDNAKQIRVNGRNTWVCEDANGNWMACSR